MDQRERLIEAAIHCLQERGYARTTTRDIVAAAGVHLPAVNYYFGSKDALLKAAVTRALRTWTESVMAATDSVLAAGPREELRAAMVAFLASLEGNRHFVVAAMEAFAQAPRGDDLGRHLAEEYRHAREAVAARIAGRAPQDGLPDSSDLRAVASVLLALFDGLAVQWLMAPDQIPDADQVVRALGLLGAVAGDSAPTPHGGPGEG